MRRLGPCMCGALVVERLPWWQHQAVAAAHWGETGVSSRVFRLQHAPQDRGTGPIIQSQTEARFLLDCCRAAVDGQAVRLARAITVNGDTCVLRAASGQPVWSTLRHSSAL
jgi:hypothetical protein